MATRKPALKQQDKPADVLTVEKASFTAKLLERIELGKDLVDRQVTNVDEL